MTCAGGTRSALSIAPSATVKEWLRASSPFSRFASPPDSITPSFSSALVSRSRNGALILRKAGLDFI